MALCIVWAILIFIGCTMSPAHLPQLNVRHIDKVEHFVVFFVQSVLLSVLLHFKFGKSYVKIIFLSTMLAFVYGGVIEIVQSKFFDRTGDYVDLIADVLGGFFGATAYIVLLKLFRKCV